MLKKDLKNHKKKWENKLLLVVEICIITISADCSHSVMCDMNNLSNSTLFKDLLSNKIKYVVIHSQVILAK